MQAFALRGKSPRVRPAQAANSSAERREARPRGRPRKVTDEGVPVLPGQEKLI